MNDARVDPTPTDQRAHQRERDAGADDAEHGNRNDRAPLPARIVELPQPIRGGPDRGEREHLRHQVDRAVALLHRAGERDGEAVADRGEHDQDDPEGLAGAFADRRQAHEHDADESDGDPQELGAAGGLAQQDHGEDRGEDRCAAVEQTGDRRADVLLGDREERERHGHPDDRERDESESVLGLDLRVLAGEREHGERQRPEADADEGDHARRQGVEADVDEEERRSPDDRDRQEQAPVGGRESVVDGRRRRRGRSHASTVAPTRPRPLVGIGRRVVILTELVGFRDGNVPRPARRREVRNP